MSKKRILRVVKVGGNILDDAPRLDSFLKAFASLPSPKILVHGGGKIATELAEKLGIILYSEATLNELEQVLNRKKFNKYLSLEDRQVFLLKFISSSQLVSITENITVCRD